MYNFIRVEPEYTGGGIYCFIGTLDGNKHFLASDNFYDVRIIDTNPFEVDYEDLWYDEWQEAHLIEDLTGNDRLVFFEEMIKWLRQNGRAGNYAMEELEARLEEINKIRESES